MRNSRPLLTAFLAGLLAAGAALAEAPPQADREAILAMGGEYKVNFNFKEVLTLDAGSEREPSHDHHSEAHEKVYLLEDRGDFISLQHLLVVSEGEHQHVVKHWRQDWQYEPRHLDVYKGLGTWSREKLSRREAAGAWSQTVYQVDDSPRYAGYGRWVHEGGYSRWQSNETWRPLPRRETEQRKHYDVVFGRNRHSITPTGWLHEQDNYKLDLTDGGSRIIALETGFNTYDHVEGVDFSAADAYWEGTHQLWARVREQWSKEFEARDSLHLHNDGRGLYRKVLGLADEFREGKLGSLDEAHAAIAAKMSEALDRPVEAPEEDEVASAE